MASYRLWGDRIHKTVILDSSAILMLFEFQIDLEDELTRILGSFDIVIPTTVIRELEFLSLNGRGHKKVKAKASLKLIEKYSTVDVDGKDVDDSIFKLAKKINGIVVTNDRELRNRIREISLSVIYLRAKKKLEIE